MKPYISIILPTMRFGGLDIVFSSLENQTFKDFELILVDDLYDYRKDIVAEKAKQYSVKYKHITPLINKLPVQSQGHAVNSGIVNASGDVILLVTDYRYFMPDMLKKHADFHKSMPDNFGFGGASKFVFPPPLKSGIPHYGDNYEQYLGALKNNEFKDYMWSIYENEYDKNTRDPSNLIEHDRLKLGYDPKADILPYGEVNPLHIFLQNDSIKTKIILEANGINEAMDGFHGPIDQEFSHRLRSMFDFKFLGDNTTVTYRITGGGKIIGKLKLTENRDDLYSVFEKYRDGSKDPVNDWNLAKVHAYNQNKSQ
jgi:glycosyltransferase involved in cell wall biosynthesis